MVCAIRSKAVFNTWSEYYQQEILLTELTICDNLTIKAHNNEGIIWRPGR